MADFLFNHLLQIEKKLLESNSIVLFLDYDGTLVSFKDRPTEVNTPKKIKKIIRQLIKNPKIIVIIVTGRSLHDIKKLLHIKGLSFIALHGLQIETLGGFKYSWEQANQARLLVKSIKEHLQKEFKTEKGVIIEDKELTIVLHYRLLPVHKRQNVLNKFKKIVSYTDTKKIFEIIKGEKVIEARPKGWNKGKAIELFLAKHMKKKNFLSIYIGDDITDEDAFKYLGGKGISIYVSNQSKRRTAAQYWVNDPDEVFFFLQFVSQFISQK